MLIFKSYLSILLTLILSIQAYAQQTIPGGIIVEKNIIYSSVDGKNLLLDIYYPQMKSDTPMPLVVWIHGGAFRAGNKNRNQAIELNKHGYITASINYRLSQEALWPALIHDCKAAIRYLRAHADQYKINPDKIGVWGSSAGGYLTAFLGTSGDVKVLEGEGEWQDQSSRVQAVVDFYGPTNFIKMCDFPSKMDHAAADSPESQLLGAPVKKVPDKVKAADPITYISKDDPPFLIVHGDQDPLVPHNQSVILHEALEKAGIDNTLITVKGGGHGRWDNTTKPTRDEIQLRVREFFDKHLK